MHAAYIQSVKNAVYSERRVGRHIPAAVGVFVGRMRSVVMNRLPVTPMCVTHIQHEFDLTALQHKIVTRMVVQLGYDMETSMLLWRNFRLNFPGDPFAYGAKQLLSRQQLVEQYGKTYGEMLAQVITEPDSQPILGALLRGETAGTMHSLTYSTLLACGTPNVKEADIKDAKALAECAITDVETLWYGRFGSAATPTDSSPPVIMDWSTASSIYEDAIRPLDGSLPHGFSIDPKFVDYNAEADRAENR
jgi:hypothetical protein